MYRTNFIKNLSRFENSNIEAVFGKIDKEIILNENFDSLCYIFPLIERITLELYKLYPSSDVEEYQQGTMRSILSVISKSDSAINISDRIINLLNKYYGDDGLRNKLFHVYDSTGEVCIYKKDLEYGELYELLSYLLECYMKKSSDFSDDIFAPISLLKTQDN